MPRRRSTGASAGADNGLVVDGVRHESPDLAAIAASGNGVVDGWAYWTLLRAGKPAGTLAELRAGNA